MGNAVVINFPNETIMTLEQLGQWLGKQTEAVTVQVRAGRYEGSLALRDLQSPSVQIIGENQQVFFSGAQKISATFQRYNHSLLVTQLAAGLQFDRLKVNGEPWILARYPNYTQAALFGGKTTLADVQARAASWGEEKQGTLCSLHRHEWGANSYRIQGVQHGALQLEWVGNNNRGSALKEDCVMVENIFSELDAPKEWYYNRETGALYLYCDGEFTPQMELELFLHTTLVSVTNCRASEILLQNICFTDTDRSMFRFAWHRYLRSDWGYNFNSAVELSNSEHVRIAHCRFDNLGNNCVGIYKNSREICITDCEFTNSLTNGVLVCGDADSTYCTSSWENDQHKTEMEYPDQTGPKNEQYPKQVVIADSYFYNLGKEDKQSAAVCLSLCFGVTVDGCTIHHLPRAGINIAENAFGGHRIQNCDVFDCVRETGDHGPFNSWGRDRFWSLEKMNTTGKYGQIKKPYALHDMLAPNILAHNRFVGKKGFGIDLDDGSNQYIIENNFCYGVGIKLREGFFRTVRNNLVLYAPLDLHATFEGNDDAIYHNIVCCNKPLSVFFLNKGYTTALYENGFVNAARKTKRHALNKGGRNAFLTVRDVDYQTIAEAFPLFEPFSFSFGKAGKPPPDLSAIQNDAKLKRIRNRYGTFTALNENKRSMAGAPDLNGLYVEKLALFSPLKKLGVQPNDVLLAVDGQTLVQAVKPNWRALQQAKQLEIVRQQKTQILK